MAKPIHMMIRVFDEARSVAFYQAALGFEIADRYAFDDFTLVYLRSPDSPFEIELTINHGRMTPYEIGAGYGHVAVVVDNLGWRVFVLPGNADGSFRPAQSYWTGDRGASGVECAQRAPGRRGRRGRG